METRVPAAESGDHGIGRRPNGDAQDLANEGLANSHARPGSLQRGGRFLLSDPDATVDLRRTRKREVIDEVVRRSQWLDPTERALVRAVLGAGRPVAELAKLMDTDPRSLRKHLRGVMRRALAPAFMLVVSQREHWTPVRRRIAEACFVQGQSMREASRSLGISLHTVRTHCAAVRHQCEMQAQIAASARATSREGVREKRAS